jgi:hypothetical protein
MYFKNFRLQAGKYLLRREAGQLKRVKTAFNMSEAKSFVILFEASKMEDVDLVKKYVNYLKEMKKKVRVIGYFNTEFPPEFTYSKLEYEFFSIKQLSWQLKPSSSFLRPFLSEEFDVLIDLNFEDHFPLIYLSTLSKARFKVGKFSRENEKIHDLLIDITKGKTFRYLLQQVDIYLQMINNKKPG